MDGARTHDNDIDRFVELLVAVVLFAVGELFEPDYFAVLGCNVAICGLGDVEGGFH